MYLPFSDTQYPIVFRAGVSLNIHSFIHSFIHICQKRGHHGFFLDKSPIPVVEETKCLGVIFDGWLSFIPHLKYVKKKGLKVLNIQNVISKTKCDRKVILRLYIYLVRSKLDCGCIVYGSAHKSYAYLQMLDPVHNQCFTLCLGSVGTSPVYSLYVDAHEPSLCVRRANKLSLQYTSKIKSLPKHPTHDAMFDNKYMKLFDAWPNTIRTFDLCIKQFLSASNIDFQTF